MATLSASVALDMDDWNLGNPLDGAIRAHTPHHFSYKDGIRTFDFGGSGLTYLNLLLVVPLGGTVKSLNISDGSTNIFSLSGFTIGVPELMTLLTANQWDTLLPTLLAKNDIITGSAQNDILNGFGGNDTINGADGGDKIKGGVGADTLTGGASLDTFAYDNAGDSNGALHDKIMDFDAAQDRFLFDAAVTGVDAAITHGKLGSAFDANLSNAADAAHLGAHHAVLFTPSAGKHAGETYLVVDLNGNAGYQAGEDVVVQMVDVTHLTGLGVGNFIVN